MATTSFPACPAITVSIGPDGANSVAAQVLSDISRLQYRLCRRLLGCDPGDGVDSRGDATRHTFAVFFGGWAIGWLSASIARVVYPPPKPRRPIDAGL